MISFLKNKIGVLLFISLIKLDSYGQVNYVQTVTQTVMNVDPSTLALTTEECVSVRLVVDYMTPSGAYSVTSSTHYVTNGQTKTLSANFYTDEKYRITGKKLIFNTDSHVITFVVPEAGLISQNYGYIESCIIGIPQLYWTLTLGGSSSLVTYYIHQ